MKKKAGEEEEKKADEGMKKVKLVKNNETKEMKFEMLKYQREEKKEAK